MHTPKLKTYKHNDLFGPGDNWNYNACVGTNGGPYNEMAYALGYFEAAERLAKSVEENRRLLDLVIYPLAFTNRHGIELALKHLAKQLPALWDEEPFELPKHTLMEHWDRTRPYLERDASFDPLHTVPMVDAALKDFVEIDPSGEAFRFPASRSGSRFLQDSSMLNILVFNETMQSVRTCFRFWFEANSELWALKTEI
jgi:hypothetical protein